MHSKNWYLSIGIAVFLIVAFGVFFTFDPSEASFFPACPLKSATGLDCPGCGSQRAIHQLLHLNFKEAFLFNPLLILSLPYLLFAVWVDRIRPTSAWSQTWRRRLMGPKSVWVILAVVIIFFVARNLI
ncbi:MAG: hypothetical protein ACJAU0_002606 [Flavobacteriales bacterium]